MSTYKPIAESNNFIVLEHFKKNYLIRETPQDYQTEAALEREFIADLLTQGYENAHHIKTPNQLLANARLQIEKLNEVKFSDDEWQRYLSEYLNKASDTLIEKSKKIHDDYIYDFVFDDGHIQNIYLVDKINVLRNKVQVLSQFEQTGTHANRYDVTILVNGLPLVQVELKKRGVAIREAFNQVHRYSKESFNSENSLFQYVQVFVISNGTDSRYFANTISRDKNSFNFTMNWANVKNETIKDLKDFTATFFQKSTLLNVILTYSVFDTNNTLLIMRPYQIAATERILWKIHSAYQSKKWSSLEGGGFIWHTTGSGKTLSSFKAARLATQLDFIDKVFFVVDRKDLDYQTMKEYQRFSPDSVNGSDNTAGLLRNIEKDDNKIIVTTIQKLNNLMKTEKDLAIFNKQVVFIFDEAHRSQFGEAQKNLKKKFKFYYQFGFTGTPIFDTNSITAETTASVFGRELHSYVITDAIRDEKVLKFKVDYNDVRPQFKSIESEQDEVKLSAAENKMALLHPNRIEEISKYILKNFKFKTHRNGLNSGGFNALFAVSSVDAAKCYYETINQLQENSEKPLRIATIFSYAANGESQAKGDITDENFEPTALDQNAKEFLDKAIKDYNAYFKTNFGTDSKEFQNYYRDLAKRVKSGEIDLLIVVGMFLTGFDAPRLNTLFVDKNLRYHGLIQAYSRTNRILNSTKTFGNIITFRDLEQPTLDAITLFGNSNTREFVLEKSFDAYLGGFNDIINGQESRGYNEVVQELSDRFPNPQEIFTENDKKDFVKLFGDYLRIENILQNYDEFSQIRELKKIDAENPKALEDFKIENHLTDEELASFQQIEVLPERTLQDYRSAYNDIYEWKRQEKKNQDLADSTIDWNDLSFEVDLLKSQEINLDFILELIYEQNKNKKDKTELVEDIRRMIRSNIGNRAKESLVIDFINETNLDTIEDKASIIDSFFAYAQVQQSKEVEQLITDENLKSEEAKRYITTSLKREYASENGTELNGILPKMSPLNPQFLTKKQSVFQKISAFVEKYKGVGGEL